MFFDVTEQKPGEQKPTIITVQYLNYLLAHEYSTLQPCEILSKFKFIGLVVSEDSESRGRLPGLLSPQTFTVGIQGLFQIFDYWGSGSTTSIARRYDDCFMILKKIRVHRNTIFNYSADPAFGPIKFESKNNEDFRWQIVPHNHRNGRTVSRNDECWRVSPNSPREFGAYWYIGRIHEYATLADADVASGDDVTRSISTQDMDHMMKHSCGRLMQFYIDCDPCIS